MCTPTASPGLGGGRFSILSNKLCAHPDLYATDAHKGPSEGAFGTFYLKVQNDRFSSQALLDSSLLLEKSTEEA